MNNGFALGLMQVGVVARAILITGLERGTNRENMTRQNLLSGLLVTPLAVLAGRNVSAAEPQERRVVRFAPGTYTIGPGGGIRISGTGNVRIEGCTITGTSEGIMIE
jgi:hypothetical protein